MARWIKPGHAKGMVPSQSVPTTATPETLPETLAGIDVKAGLATTAGNQTLYLKLLNRFREGQSGFEAAYRSALQVGNLPEATRHAHTLKGVAGTIGARKLQKSAAILEDLSHHARPAEELDAALTQTTAELAVVLNGLHTLEAAIPPAAFPKQGAAVDDLQARLRRLPALLDQGDVEAMNHIHEIESLLDTQERAGMFAELLRHVEAFEFEAAATEARRIMAELKISGE